MECYDGNTVDGDGCSSQCTIEPKYICVVNYTTNKCKCTGTPGDGILEPNDECDYYQTNYPENKCICNATHCSKDPGTDACEWVSNGTDETNISIGYSVCFLSI